MEANDLSDTPHSSITSLWTFLSGKEEVSSKYVLNEEEFLQTKRSLITESAAAGTATSG